MLRREGVLKARQPGWFEAMMRALSVKGPLPEEIDPRLQMGVQLDDMRRPEYAWAQRQLYWAASRNVPAGGAGTFCTVAIVGRTGTGRALASEVTLYISNPAAAGTFRVSPFALPTVGTLDDPVSAEARSYAAGGIGPLSSFQVVYGAAVAVPIAAGDGLEFIIGANGTLVLPVPFSLTDKDNTRGIVVCTTVANSQITVGATWRERRLSPEEV